VAYKPDCRQYDAETRAAARPVLHRDAPAEAQNQMPRDGKTKPGTAAIAIARGLKTQERLENPLTVRARHARAAIIDQHYGFSVGLRDRHRRFASIFHRVVDQVPHDTRERRRIAPDIDRRHRHVAFDGLTGRSALAAFATDNLGEVDPLAAVAGKRGAGECERIIEQRAHLLDIAGRALAHLSVRHHLDAQPQTRQIGAQIV
jgi:hypothetical protein